MDLLRRFSPMGSLTIVEYGGANSCFADRIRKAHHRIMETYRFARLHFIVDVRLARAVITNKNDGEMRDFFILLFAFSNTLCDLCFNISRNFLAVNQGVIRLCFNHRVLINFEYSHECFLWYFYRTDLAHPLFTFLLFLEEFAFTGDVTTITFRDHVFTNR